MAVLEGSTHVHAKGAHVGRVSASVGQARPVLFVCLYCLLCLFVVGKFVLMHISIFLLL